MSNLNLEAIRLKFQQAVAMFMDGIELSNRTATDNQANIRILSEEITQLKKHLGIIDERLTKLEGHHHTYTDSNATLWRGKQFSSFPTSKPTYNEEKE